MGKPQHLDAALRAAAYLQNELETQLLPIGGGAERVALFELAGSSRTNLTPLSPGSTTSCM